MVAETEQGFNVDGGSWVAGCWSEPLILAFRSRAWRPENRNQNWAVTGKDDGVTWKVLPPQRYAGRG